MILIFLLICVTVIFFYFVKFKKSHDIASKIHGPKGLPILGYTKFFTLPIDDFFTHLIELQNKYKDYYKVWVGSNLWVIIYEPKLSEKILTNQKLLKGGEYDFLKPWLGNGLLTNEGKSWHARRKAITPAFHFNILEDFIEVFARQSDVLVEKIRKEKIDGDIMPHLILCALDIICETAMGLQTDVQNDMKSNYVEAVKKVCYLVFIRMFNPFLGNNFIFRFTKYYKPYTESLKIAHETTKKIIEDRRKQILQNLPESGEVNSASLKDEFGRRKKMALLDILLKTTIDGKLLTDEEILEEVNTFTFAGHDTTSTSLGFLLYNIAKYPDIQQKLYEEIVSVFGDSKSDVEITSKKLSELKYLDLVMKESMRMHTTAPFVGRRTLEEIQIDELHFPKDTNISIYVYGLHHRSDLFPEPEKFIPERFELTNKNGDKEKLHPFAYIPFSAGHRNCIGQKFALYQMKTMIVKILQNFKLHLKKPNEELILFSEIVLRSQNGIHLKFEERMKS